MPASIAGSNRVKALTAGALVLIAGASAVAGPDWIERGDAGSSVGTAQIPVRPDGATALNSISGTLTGPSDQRGVGDFEDMYIISISNPGTFSLTLINADFNPVFYLFNLTLANQAYGLLANDDANAQTNIPALTNAATDATGVVITAPGDYLLAITGKGDSPLSITGPIFNIASPDEISGPDGVGGYNPLLGWTGGGEWGNYNFAIVGTDFPTTPTPGAAGVFGLAGAAMLRRRR